MATSINKIMVVAGAITFFQAGGQFVYSVLALVQYFCIIDFLVELPGLIFIRILYFHNPGACETRINIGQAIEGMANQAFVLISKEPLTVTRTFYINAVSAGLSFVWFLTSISLMTAGARNNQRKLLRWPWIVVTLVVCGVDLVATVIFINDTFYTRTLSDMMEYTGGIVSGAGGAEVNTAWTAWIMVIVYSRGVFLFVLNVSLIVVVLIAGHVKQQQVESTAIQVEAPKTTTEMNTSTSSFNDDAISLCSERPTKILPRPTLKNLRNSFRLMKMRLFRESSPTAARSLPNSIIQSPERSPKPQRVNEDKQKQKVNFPENLLSLPQKLKNLISDQHKRLDKIVQDAEFNNSPQASQSMPQLVSSSSAQAQNRRGRRGNAAELQRQLPWAYIPASGHPMRDQLPPDEDLPPVPLPDYTAIPSFRKASVHRAASSLSSLTQKKDNKERSHRPPLTQMDVLY